MAVETKIPPMHFANDLGVDSVRISVRTFKCIGARPPMDHPHVFLDMGKETQIVCPYCSTKYIFDSRVTLGKVHPPEALYNPEE